MTRVFATAGGNSNIEIGGGGGDNRESRVANFRVCRFGFAVRGCNISSILGLGDCFHMIAQTNSKNTLSAITCAFLWLQARIAGAATTTTTTTTTATTTIATATTITTAAAATTTTTTTTTTTYYYYYYYYYCYCYYYYYYWYYYYYYYYDYYYSYCTLMKQTRSQARYKA